MRARLSVAKQRQMQALMDMKMAQDLGKSNWKQSKDDTIRHDPESNRLKNAFGKNVVETCLQIGFEPGLLKQCTDAKWLKCIHHPE